MWSVLTSVEEDGRAWLRDFLSLRSTQCLHLVSLPLRRPRWPRCNKAAGEQWRGATGGENPGHLGTEVLVLEKVLARASRHGSACAREGSSTGHGSPCSLGRCLQCAEPWVGLSSLLGLFLSTPPHLPLWLITKPRAEPTVLFSSFPPAIHCAGGGLNMSVRSCRRRLCCL